MSKPNRVTDAPHPCPVCGKPSFLWGSVSTNNSTRTYFAADGRGTVDLLLGEGKAAVRARLCLACKHLDLFAPDFEL